MSYSETSHESNLQVQECNWTHVGGISPGVTANIRRDRQGIGDTLWVGIDHFAPFQRLLGCVGRHEHRVVSRSHD